VKICETIDKNQQYKKNRKQTKTTQPEITYLADFFKVKPPCRAEGFGAGMAAEKISSPSRARNGVIDN
jgi:hypothetical protein